MSVRLAPQELVAFHYIKKAEGMAFLWRLFHDDAPFDAAACHKLTSKWGIYI